jgi:predicted NBD/HSP70 family sugar kinase
LFRNGRSDFLAALLEEKGSIEARDVARGATHGDPTCVELVTNAGRLVGHMLASVVNFYNPSLIVIGGGVAGAGDLLLATIRETVYRRSLPLATRELVIKRSELGDLAGVVGAAVMVTDELFRPTHLAQWLGVGTPNGGHVVAAPH